MSENRTSPQGPLKVGSGMINSEIGEVAGAEINPLRRLSSDGRGGSPEAQHSEGCGGSPKVLPAALQDLQSDKLNEFSERTRPTRVENDGEAFEDFHDEKRTKSADALKERITEIEEEYRDSLEKEMEIAQALADELERKIERMAQPQTGDGNLPDPSQLDKADRLATDCSKHLSKAGSKFTELEKLESGIKEAERLAQRCSQHLRRASEASGLALDPVVLQPSPPPHPKTQEVPGGWFPEG